MTASAVRTFIVVNTVTTETRGRDMTATTSFPVSVFSYPDAESTVSGGGGGDNNDPVSATTVLATAVPSTASYLTVISGKASASASASAASGSGSGHSGVDTGTAAGIGVGVTLGVVAVIVILILIWRRRRAKRGAVAPRQENEEAGERDAEVLPRSMAEKDGLQRFEAPDSSGSNLDAGGNRGNDNGGNAVGAGGGRG